MVANYDAGNTDNWQQIHLESFTATYYQGNYIPIYTPIPRQELLVSVTSPVLAIYCTSTQYPDRQKYLGRVIQSVSNPSSLPSSISTGNSVSLYANQTVLADFSQFDDTYSLIIAPKFYVEQLTITVFEYVGSEFYEVENRLNIIEQKIDQLL